MKEFIRKSSGMLEIRFPQNDGKTLRLLKFKSLEETGIVENAFSTRMGGVSSGYLGELNLSFTRGDDPANVQENFRRVAEALGTTPDRMIYSMQTHTTNVHIVTKDDAGNGITKPQKYTDVDGLVTDIPGITLVTTFADCVPLYFVDPVHKAIGLSHSGWRGTVHRMGEVTIKLMQEKYDTRPEDLICAIGPSICQDCYEVSEDVAEEFQKEFPGHEAKLLINKGNGKYQLDLWAANRQVLLDAGVNPEHIEVTDICTCCNPELMFSHRASHGKRGNLCAFLSLKEEKE